MDATHMRLADYRIKGELGRGSYGVVYRVRNNKDNVIYVLKQIPISTLSSKYEKEALKEVQILRQLNHPHIIKYYDSFIERGAVNIIMEYAEGGDLHRFIKRRREKKKHLSERELWQYAFELTSAVAYLHQRNIIHRDIKCMNVLLTKSNHLKLADLGASKITGEAAMQVTRIGTPLFLAPELVKQTPYDFKVDSWAVGCVMYQLASFEAPFHGENLISLGNAIVYDQPKPLPMIYSQKLSDLVFALLEKKPSARLSVSEALGLISEYPQGVKQIQDRNLEELATDYTLAKSLREEPYSPLIPHIPICKPENVVEAELTTPKQPTFLNDSTVLPPSQNLLKVETAAEGKGPILQYHQRPRLIRLTIKNLRDVQDSQAVCAKVQKEEDDSRLDLEPVRPRTSSCLRGTKDGILPYLRANRPTILGVRYATPVKGLRTPLSISSTHMPLAKQPRLQALLRPKTGFHITSMSLVSNSKKKVCVADLN